MDKLFNSHFKSNEVEILPEGVATTFLQVNVPSGGIACGLIFYSVEASNGTDSQLLSRIYHYSVVNKNGTLTINTNHYTNVTAESGGTLSVEITMTDAGGGVAEIKANPLSSLTQNILKLRYQSIKHF